MDNDNLKALTVASDNAAINHAEQARLATSKTSSMRMRGAAGLAVSALLATSLFLSACGDEDDCIPTTPPPAGSSSSGVFGTPVADPSQPGSSQFTTGQPAASSQTYCRSRRTGGYYFYTGSRYYSSGSSSGSSSS